MFLSILFIAEFFLGNNYAEKDLNIQKRGKKMGFFDFAKDVFGKAFDKLVETSGQIELYQAKVANKSDEELIRIIKDSTAPTMLRSNISQDITEHNGGR